MTATDETVREILLQALSGRGAHVLVHQGLDGLDWEDAGRSRQESPHTIFQIVRHLTHWQEFSLAWIDGEKPETPAHAAQSWPGEPAPVGHEEWTATSERFIAGLGKLQERGRTLDLMDDRGPKTVLEILQLIASHNSYHMGQLALARRAIGAWPPPAGGATW